MYRGIRWVNSGTFGICQYGVYIISIMSYPSRYQTIGGYDMRFEVNDNCIGCGLCASLCPAVFHLTEEGVAEAISEDITGEHEPEAVNAMEGCPVAAIEER